MENVPNSEAIISRIRHLMYLNRMTQIGLAKKLGIDPSNVSKYLAGKLPLNDSFLNRIIVNLNISKDWLRDGVGVPYEKSSHAIEVPPSTLSTIGGGIPVYDIDVAAGCTEMSRAFSREYAIGSINFPQLNPDWVVVRAKGDSMTPTIINGGYVVFLPQSDMSNILWGQIYVIVMSNRRVVKYVRRHPDPSKIILKSANSAYDDMDVPLDDIQAMYVVERIINIQDCF